MATVFEGMRDAIVARLNTVANIGVVQSRERWSDDWQDFLNLFKDTPSSSIRGWTVTWDGNKDVESEAAALGQRAYAYTFVIRGYLAFSDANNSEDTFGVLIEGVRDSLNNQRTFGVSGILPFSGVVEVAHHEKRIFGSVLCHYAEVMLTVTYVETIAWA